MICLKNDATSILLRLSISNFLAVVLTHGSASALVQGSSASSASSAKPDGKIRGPVSSTRLAVDAVGNALGPVGEEYVGDMGDVVDVFDVNFAAVDDIVVDFDDDPRV